MNCESHGQAVARPHLTEVFHRPIPSNSESETSLSISRERELPEECRGNTEVLMADEVRTKIDS